MRIAKIALFLGRMETTDLTPLRAAELAESALLVGRVTPPRTPRAVAVWNREPSAFVEAMRPHGKIMALKIKGGFKP